MKQTPEKVPIFDLNHFRSMQVNVDLKNKTAKTEIRPGQRVFGDERVKLPAENLNVLLLEFQEDPPGLVLEVPERSCSKGHILHLNFQLSGPCKSKKFAFTVKVNELEQLDSYRLRVSVGLVKAPDKTWSEFLACFQKNQDIVKEIFNKFRQD